MILHKIGLLSVKHAQITNSLKSCFREFFVYPSLFDVSMKRTFISDLKKLSYANRKHVKQSITQGLQRIEKTLLLPRVLERRREERQKQR